jgi:hypothetical protein
MKHALVKMGMRMHVPAVCVLTSWAAASVLLHVLGEMRLVAEDAGGLLEGAHQMMRLEVARLRAQHVLPAATFLVMRAAHAQLPKHGLHEWLGGEARVRE